MGLIDKKVITSKFLDGVRVEGIVLDKYVGLCASPLTYATPYPDNFQPIDYYLILLGNDEITSVECSSVIKIIL